MIEIGGVVGEVDGWLRAVNLARSVNRAWQLESAQVFRKGFNCSKRRAEFARTAT